MGIPRSYLLSLSHMEVRRQSTALCELGVGSLSPHSLTPQIALHLDSTRNYAHTDSPQETMLHERSLLAYRTALAGSDLEVVTYLDLFSSVHATDISTMGEGSIPFVISLSTYPGTIAFTRTPCPTYSAASARVNPNTPALLAAYATAPYPPLTPNRLDTLTMDGVKSGPASTRVLVVECRYLLRSKKRVPSIKAVRFVSTMSWMSSVGVVVNNLD